MSETIIKLNVGGKHFSTLFTTLTKQIRKDDNEFYEPHLLNSILNFQSSDKAIIYSYHDDEVFIDRNPKYFNIFLDYLRQGNENFKAPSFSQDDFDELKEEAKFYKLYGLIEIINSTDLDSIILNTEAKNNLMKLCEFSNKQRWKKLYRASEDGFDPLDFHFKCDGYSNTLTVMKTTDNYIFGGYTSNLWDSYGPAGIQKPDSNAFIFSLINPYQKPLKLKCFKNRSRHGETFCSNKLGPTFGEQDLVFKSDGMYDSCLGDMYESPEKYFNNFDHEFSDNTFLTGESTFSVSEIEVFHKFCSDKNSNITRYNFSDTCKTWFIENPNSCSII